MSLILIKSLFVACLIIYYTLFTIHRIQNHRARPKEIRLPWQEMLFMPLAFIGDTIIPLIYIFSPWLSFADYPIIPAVSLFGTLLFAVSLWLFWRAHRDLGQNWSPNLQIKETHTLVTGGVYRYIRHPVYAAHWLWGLAQLFMLPNWVAGLSNIILFLPAYLYRVPLEEQMMLDHFGQAYQAYMTRTGRVFPRRGK